MKCKDTKSLYLVQQITIQTLRTLNRKDKAQNRCSPKERTEHLCLDGLLSKIHLENPQDLYDFVLS
jgi:hypothetical protein